MRDLTLLTDDTFTHLRHILLQATQLPEIIGAHPDAPRPVGDYGVLALLRSSQIQNTQDWTELDPDTRDINDDFPGGDFEDAPLLAYTQAARSWVYQFDVFCAEPIDVLNRLDVWKHTAEGQLRFWPLVLHSVTDALRIPEQKENAWHERGTIDLELHGRVYTLRSETQVEEFLGGVPTDELDPATIDIFEVDAERDLQNNLNTKPLRPAPLADKLAEINIT